MIESAMLNRAVLLIRNRDAAKEAFRWNTGMVHLACAGIYTQRGLTCDTASLKSTRELLRASVGVFNSFRSTGEDIFAAMLDASGHPQELLEKTLRVYQLLRDKFYASSYLPMAALVIAENADPARYDEIAARTRVLYERMRQDHPFLTSGEDSGLCALLAMSEKTDDTLLSRAEKAYAILKPHFFDSNMVQTLTHVIALNDGDCNVLCDRVLALREKFKESGNRWGYSYELPMLGTLALDQRRDETIIEDSIACDDYLKSQSGFGFFSSVSRPQRLMYAAMCTMDAPEVTSVSAATSTISAILAAELATIAAVSAATAASSSHS